MRVLVWPAGTINDATTAYRLRFPTLALAAQGCDVELDTTGPSVLWDRDWSGQETAPLDARIVGLAAKPDADVVVIQRPGRAHWAELIPHLQDAGVRVVCDLDDDFDAIPSGNIARSHYDPKVNPRHNRDWIRKAADLADLVTVSTRPLAGRYGRHGRVTVLPNLVPEAYLRIQGDKQPGTVGWSGSVDTHPGDLETVGTALRDVLAANEGWRVHVVGTGKGVAKRLRVGEVTSTAGWLPFGEYAAALAELEVGIVPLNLNRFAAAKSCLKMIEMAAVGVPVVAAPIPDNKRLSSYGVGLLASSPSEWRKHLGALMGSADHRAEVAGRSRAAMAAHTYEQWAEIWWAAWESALDRKTVAA